MRNLFAIVFVLVSFVVSGCFSSHGSPDLVAPMVDNSDPFVGGDAGPTVPDAGPITYDAGPTELDAGPTEPDLGPIEVDAGSDAGPIIEPDAGTVRPLVIEAFEMLESGILLPGPSFASGYGVAVYRVGPNESLPSVTLNLDGDAADVN